MKTILLYIVFMIGRLIAKHILVYSSLGHALSSPCPLRILARRTEVLALKLHTLQSEGGKGGEWGADSTTVR